MIQDQFQSIAEPATGLFTDRGSKFLAYAWPVQEEEHIKEHLESLRKEHFKARHHCYAWRLGIDKQLFRANDDGEPGGTAGRPILGQIDSFGLTDVLVVVVRYFGGTLLGTSGLINAYRSAAALALQEAKVITHDICDTHTFRLSYEKLPDFTQQLMRTEARIVSEEYGETDCLISFSVRQSLSQIVLDKLKAGMHGLPATEAPGLDWSSGVEHLNG